jgi:hypothetical protein
VATDPLSVLAPDIAYFLGKKAHIVARSPDAGYDITEKGRESLADMDLQGH